MKISMKNGDVVIDGRSFTGRNITINGDKVIVDGVTQEGTLVGNITVTVNGDVDQLSTTSGKVYATTVTSVKTVSGDVRCQDVHGNVQTVSGDVDCTKILGSVKTTSGDINR